MKELEFVEYLAKTFRIKPPVKSGIGDDCAVIGYTGKKYTLLTCDMVIEGTHFSRNAKPFQIGWKAIAVNISDIAAMGGVPRYALVGLGVSKEKKGAFLKELIRGIKTISERFGIEIIGGDTNRSSRTVLSVAVIGDVERKRLIKRDGAKTGDFIFVTGALGEGRVKHLGFIPRLKEARMLGRNFKINSMIDLSDGLATDLNRLAGASSKGARVYKSLIPLSDKSEPLEKAIFSGEDFELLFTASEKESKKIIKHMGVKGDLPVTLIGEMVKKHLGVKIVNENGKTKKLKPVGFRHL